MDKIRVPTPGCVLESHGVGENLTYKFLGNGVESHFPSPTEVCVLSTAGHSGNCRTGQQRGRITGCHGHGPLGVLFSRTRLHASDSVDKPRLCRIYASETHLEATRYSECIFHRNDAHTGGWVPRLTPRYHETHREAVSAHVLSRRVHGMGKRRGGNRESQGRGGWRGNLSILFPRLTIQSQASATFSVGKVSSVSFLSLLPYLLSSPPEPSSVIAASRACPCS